jgi:hypothetical protein
MYSYGIGVHASAIAGVIAGVVAIPWTLKANRLHLSFAVGIAAAVFSIAYSILNPLYQLEHVSVSLLRQEIASGHLALRVTSVVIGISFCILFKRVASEPPASSWTSGTDPDEDYRLYLAEAQRGPWPLDRVAAQGSLFMVVLVGLWAFVITSRSSTITSLVNWSFAFIVDDFAISANYVFYRRVPPAKLDARKIIVGSLATFVLFIVALFQEFGPWAGWTVLVFSLLVVIVAFYRAVAPLLKAGLSTFGIEPIEGEHEGIPDEKEDVLARRLRSLRRHGLLTEEELAIKLRLLSLLYVHGARAQQVLSRDTQGRG